MVTSFEQVILAKITKKIDKVGKLALTKQKEGWFSGASSLKTLCGLQFKKIILNCHIPALYYTHICFKNLKSFTTLTIL